MKIISHLALSCQGVKYDVLCLCVCTHVHMCVCVCGRAWVCFYKLALLRISSVELWVGLVDV